MPTRFFPNYPANKVTSPFGMRTLNGNTRMHNGIDLVAAFAKLPPGQLKKVLTDDVIAVFAKYGIVIE